MKKSNSVAADPTSILRLSETERRALWQQLADDAERYINGVETLPVNPPLEPGAIRKELSVYDFSGAVMPSEVAGFVSGMLRKYQIHLAHPMYYGLFNPASSVMGMAGDFLAALYNPQIAAWSHSPFAAEVETHLINTFGALFGYPADQVEGTFTSGGAEANHTAMLVALTWKFDGFAENGVRSLASDPVFYVSTQCHHSFVKAARFCGLGAGSIRHVPVDAGLRMSVPDLERMIRADLEAGLLPFMVASNAGATNAGAIDPLAEIGGVARQYGLWYHVDAAWGGTAMFVPELRGHMAGIETGDSITWDAHKWMSVPMGAGLYLNRQPGMLKRACSIETAYMPKDAAGLDIRDPFMHSMQWSRRAIGLKIFMSLAAAGMDGYEQVIRHMARMGDLLRSRLTQAGFTICNNTPLPVVCFRPSGDQPADMTMLQNIVRDIVRSGEAWISTTSLDGFGPVFRACITSYNTAPHHIDALVELVAARVAAAGNATREAGRENGR
jgi:glutamate/tyrosine decarboxylase-like PLP-dependent enzyme